MSKAKVDLDGDEKLRDYGDQTPFYPYGESEADCELVAFLYHDGYKGKAYRAKVKVVKSDAEDRVKVGKIYMMAFKLEGKPDQIRAKKKELRQFVGGVMGQNAADESFKANDAIELLTEASSVEALDGYGVHISSRDRPATDKDGKPILDDKTGVQRIYTNRNFSAFKPAK